VATPAEGLLGELVELGRAQQPHARRVSAGGALVGQLGHEVAVLRRAVDADDRQQHGAGDAGPGGGRAEPLGDRLEEGRGPVLLDGGRVGDVDDDLGPG
jgi:hypothetical protein